MIAGAVIERVWRTASNRGDRVVRHRHAPLHCVGALAGLVPWSPLVPFGDMAAARSRDRRVRLLLTSVIVTLMFYGLAARKRSAYPLPLRPPLLVLEAWALEDVGEAALGRGPRVPLLAIVVLTSTLTAFAFLGPGTRIVSFATETIGGNRGRVPALVRVLEADRWRTEAALLGIVLATCVLAASIEAVPDVSAGRGRYRVHDAAAMVRVGVPR